MRVTTYVNNLRKSVPEKYEIFYKSIVSFGRKFKNVKIASRNYLFIYFSVPVHKKYQLGSMFSISALRMIESVID